MIPKKIHYCWFGGAPIPEDYKRCIESWRRHCPDYEIIEWNEQNYDLSRSDYMKQAYDCKKWSFVSDYARLDIIYREGGIYLDTDVEVVRNLDALLSHEAFMGFEEGNFVNSGVGFGAEADNPVIKRLRDMYDGLAFLQADGKMNMLPTPYYITDELEKLGLRRENVRQELPGVTVYPQEYFSPMPCSTGVCHMTENTYSVHLYSASWQGEKGKHEMKRMRALNRMLGRRVGGTINEWIQKAERLKTRILGAEK